MGNCISSDAVMVVSVASAAWVLTAALDAADCSGCPDIFVKKTKNGSRQEASAGLALASVMAVGDAVLQPHVLGERGHC